MTQRIGFSFNHTCPYLLHWLYIILYMHIICTYTTKNFSTLEMGDSAMEDHGQGSRESCFREWMNLQEQDLSELVQALNLSNSNEHDRATELNELIQKGTRHFQDYINKRSNLAQEDISPYFSPAWCTSLEGSMLWAGGCRPSIYVRLVYTLCGNTISSHLDEYLQGSRSCFGTFYLSARQMNSINDLQLKTIHEEDEISKKLASLQEEIADQPIAIIAKQLRTPEEASREVEEALDALYVSMKKLLDEADGLRLSTMKELMVILTPVQGVEFLATSKKLHLCVHAWGRKRDREHGRNSSNGN